MGFLEIKPFDNNAKGWADAREEAIKKLEENTKLAYKEKSDKLKMTVNVSANDFKPESDVVRLQNFLTISDIAKNSYKIKQTYLEVNIVDKDQGNKSDDSENDKYFQIRQFFCFQTFREDIEFKIDGYVLVAPVAETRSYTKKRSYKGKEEWKLEQIEFRRVIPVVSISNNEKDFFDYRNLVKPTSKKENRKEILKNAHENRKKVKELTKERNKYTKRIKTLKAHLEDEKKPLTPHQHEEIKNLISSLEPKVYKLNDKIDEEIKPLILSKQDNLAGIYEKLFNLNAMFLYENITGTPKKNIVEENKDIILNEVFDFIVKRCNELPIFAQYIWIVLIRCAMEEKIAFRFDDEENTYHIDEIIFEKFLSDALAYSEGIYQIVENSCIHSCGQTANISLRLYNVNRSSTIKQLARVTNTLSRLSDTYQEISQFKDASIYFEITLTDNAIDEDGKQLGMIDTYKGKVEDLQGLFDRTMAVDCREQAEEDVLYHYGLRTFRKIVRVNDGYFIVSSPYNDKQSKEVKHEYYIASKDKERDEKFDYGKEADDFWAWGESRFKIIIPLKAEWEK